MMHKRVPNSIMHVCTGFLEKNIPFNESFGVFPTKTSIKRDTFFQKLCIIEIRRDLKLNPNDKKV